MLKVNKRGNYNDPPIKCEEEDKIVMNGVNKEEENVKKQVLLHQQRKSLDASEADLRCIC